MQAIDAGAVTINVFQRDIFGSAETLPCSGWADIS
jgi:hypothetical protein